MSETYSPARAYAILNAEAPLSVTRGSRQGFYAQWHAEDGSTYGVLGSLSGHGSSADAAVMEVWARALKASRIVVGAYTDKRREIVWSPRQLQFVAYPDRQDYADTLSSEPWRSA